MAMTSEENSEKREAFWRASNPMVWGVGTTALILGTMALMGLHTTCASDFWGKQICEPKWKLFLNAPPNEVGDALAGFAGALAFVWIIVTVMLQSQELAEQRKELYRTRKEFETMNKLAQRQRFESTVFELIATHNNIVEAIDLQSDEYGLTSGRDCFSIFYGRLKRKYENYNANDWSELEKIRVPYDFFWERNQPNLGHYFLFNSFRVISEYSDAAEHHAKLLRALLSNQELLLLFLQLSCVPWRGLSGVRYRVPAI